MKKVFFIILPLIFLFSGCEKGYDINERVIVQGVGIDYSETGFEVTVQALNTDTYSGIGGAKVPEALVKNYYVSGKTVSDALSKLPAVAGKRPLFTHTRIILIGNEQAKRGLENVIDFFTRDSNCHAGLFAAVCSGTARETLTANETKESVPAVEIENIIKTAGNSPNTVSVHIYELVKMLREKTTSAYLPVVSITNEDKNEKKVRVTQTAIFKGDRLTDYIDLNQTEYLSVFTNEVETGSYTLDGFQYGNASFDFYSSKCKTDISFNEKNEICFNVSLKCVFDCVEFSGFNSYRPDEQILKEMEAALEKQLTDKTEDFLYKMCRKGADCMRLGRILLLKKQNIYRRYENDWENTLKKIKITVTSEVTVRRTGQESA